MYDTAGRHLCCVGGRLGEEKVRNVGGAKEGTPQVQLLACMGREGIKIGILSCLQYSVPRE